MNTSQSRSQRGWAPERLKTYQDALAINEAIPDTVCVTQAHYQDGRHLEPYRMGYHHGDPDHWHGNEKDYLRCKR